MVRLPNSTKVHTTHQTNVFLFSFCLCYLFESGLSGSAAGKETKNNKENCVCCVSCVSLGRPQFVEYRKPCVLISHRSELRFLLTCISINETGVSREYKNRISEKSMYDISVPFDHSNCQFFYIKIYQKHWCWCQVVWDGVCATHYLCSSNWRPTMFSILDWKSSLVAKNEWNTVHCDPKYVLFCK